MIRWAFNNNLWAGTFTVLQGTVAPNYSLVSLAYPERPFWPLRTVDKTSFILKIDWGAQYAVNTVALFNCNMTYCYVSLSNSPTFAVAPYENLVFNPIPRNPYNGRLQGWQRTASFPNPSNPNSPNWTLYRYAYLVLDGNAAANCPDPYFQIGGMFIGPAAYTPRDIAWNYKPTIVMPRIDVAPAHEGWKQRIIAGAPITRLSMHRLTMRAGPPAKYDQLRSWLDTETTWEQYDRVLVMLRDDDPGLTWMMRRTSQPEWDVAQDFPESDWELEEVIR